jgi:hypothetical protein
MNGLIKTPSRLTRRKKYQEIADITPSGFTGVDRVSIISLSCNCKTGIETPREATNGRFQRFFCTHQKHSCILFWWGVLSSPLNGWPDLAGSLNLMHPTAQRLRPMGGGLTFTRIPQ